MPPCSVPGPAGSSALPARSRFLKGGNPLETNPWGPCPALSSPFPQRASLCPPWGKQPSPHPLACPAWPSSPSLARDRRQSPMSLTDPLGPSVPGFSAAPQCIPFVGMTLLALRGMLSRVGSGRILRAVCSGECRLLGRGPRGRGWGGLQCLHVISEGTRWVSACSEVRPW